MKSGEIHQMGLSQSAVHGSLGEPLLPGAPPGSPFFNCRAVGGGVSLQSSTQRTDEDRSKQTGESAVGKIGQLESKALKIYKNGKPCYSFH